MALIDWENVIHVKVVIKNTSSCHRLVSNTIAKLYVYNFGKYNILMVVIFFLLGGYCIGRIVAVCISVPSYY